MDKLNLNYLKSISKNIEFNIDNSYHKSYLHFIRFFERNEINEENLIIASFFVYGWMPTILKTIKIDNKVIKDLKRAKNGHLLSIQELEKLKGFINNSIVGLSKLLHFINPDVYAIWDSKICQNLTGKNHQQKVNNARKYFEYLQKIHSVTHEKGFTEWKKEITSRLPQDYKISSLRTIEMTIFQVESLKTKQPNHNQ